MRTRKGRKVKYTRLSDKKQIVGIVIAPGVYPVQSPLKPVISASVVKNQLELLSANTGRRC